MKQSLALLLCAFMAFAALARETKEDFGIRQQDDATMKWFMDAKFGMFIHWGLYAVPANGELFISTPEITIPPSGRNWPGIRA